jgi:flagellar hook assembly protein FlgD
MDLDLSWDGEYTLFVSATDKSGNNSGALDYSVDFEVINASMISNVLNYPNPFTTSTQFVFTLTGRELPEYMKIQIYTISGKVVKEIGLDELGPIHIGVNRTQYAWDGTDQYGDRLANGVYLYRVIAKMRKEDEAEMKLFTNRISSMFRNGFGKMYLMR